MHDLRGMFIGSEVTACSTEDEQCGQFAKCNVRDPLWRIKDRIVAALATCSLAEIASETPIDETVMPVSLTRNSARPSVR